MTANTRPTELLTCLIQHGVDSGTASLLAALEGHVGLGWVVKSAQALAYTAWSGDLPMARVGSCPMAVGQTDEDHFEPVQASLLRMADRLALRSGQGAAQIHGLEMGGSPGQERSCSLWTAWRLPIAAESGELPTPLTAPPPQGLVVVWIAKPQELPQEGGCAESMRREQAQSAQAAQEHPHFSGVCGLSPVTGEWAGSREDLLGQIRREAALFGREGRRCALMLLAWTGALGGPAAEAALQDLARKAIGGQTRAMDTVVQISPSRFAVLLSGASMSTAFARSESLRRRLDALSLGQFGGPHPPRWFAAVSGLPLTSEDACGLLRATEHALGQALDCARPCTRIARVPLALPLA